MQFLSMTADLNTDGGRASKPEIEQHEIGLLLLQQSPIGRLVLRRSDDFGLGDIVADNTLRALQLQGHVLYDDYFEVFHTLGNVIIIFVVPSIIVA